MTDFAQTAAASSIHTSATAKQRLAKRYRREWMFRSLGLLAVLAAGGFLVMLLYTLVSQAVPAFTYHYLNLPLDLTEENVDPANPRAANYDGIIRGALRGQLDFVEGRTPRRELGQLASSGAGVVLGRDVLANPSLLGETAPYPVLLDDYADLYLKGLVTEKQEIATIGIAAPTGVDGTIQIFSTANDFSAKLIRIKNSLARSAEDLRSQALAQAISLARAEIRLGRIETELGSSNEARKQILEAEKAKLEKDYAILQAHVTQLGGQASALDERSKRAGASEALDEALPSYLVYINDGVVKVTLASNTNVEGEVLIPLSSDQEAKAGEWRIAEILQPEALRKISDRQIVYLERLQEAGLIERHFNSIFFSAGASRNPEMAGIWGAIVGSFFTMLVTLAIAFPLGVASAIYLEEFAKKNRFTDLIEVNINNLAAVPSIVFGLLGLAVFLNFFSMPRSAPVVGGLVLALMTLPTIIIAARAALKAVPPSIREAALGVGASHLQTVFHHVLPLAMPGILTGTIIGMAQALGETAPLLMIGMVAFIADIPGGFFDPATVLPVQIFMWADFPEPAFQQKTSAAIIVLLLFLIVMNALAVFLRKRFERRW